MGRPSKDEYYLRIALEVARRGTCIRRNYGAVIVNHDQIVSTGYTGAPRGTPNCVDFLKTCPRAQRAIPQGHGYDLCRSVHAEVNALLHASRMMVEGATLFLAGSDAATGSEVPACEPCYQCRRAIINSGISRVVRRATDGTVSIIDVQDWIAQESANPFWFLPDQSVSTE